MNANNIATIRKKKGMTQEELAQALSINVITLSRWENGLFEPRISFIKKICEVLGCSESELLNGSSKQNWELKLLINCGQATSKGVIDLTGKTSTATLEISDVAMGITLSASYDLWEDYEKFEGLIAQLRKKRSVGLRTRRENWE